MEELIVNEYWKIRKNSPRSYSAISYEGEHRLYFSRYGLERDFGQVVFPSEGRIKTWKNSKEEI